MSLLMIDDHAITHHLKRRLQLPGTPARFLLCCQCPLLCTLALVGQNGNDASGSRKRQQLEQSTPPIHTKHIKRWDIQVIEDEQTQHDREDRRANPPDQRNNRGGKKEQDTGKKEG